MTPNNSKFVDSLSDEQALFLATQMRQSGGVSRWGVREEILLLIAARLETIPDEKHQAVVNETAKLFGDP